ncbi:hypothetical protein CLIB1423_04S05468 [[Candida] railenensis]|uniref:LicD/FKTN/FKRP nucleotidyltransferase domain-containing protein n=1 Tax=[Candida] railenensis TaxID=45579 RepID=A0A9P0QNE0_9ASCO|nr:hypothetical protein CLIB1423_04S05468 [[Candida] railenensis]
MRYSNKYAARLKVTLNPGVMHTGKNRRSVGKRRMKKVDNNPLNCSFFLGCNHPYIQNIEMVLRASLLALISLIFALAWVTKVEIPFLRIGDSFDSIVNKLYSDIEINLANRCGTSSSVDENISFDSKLALSMYLSTLTVDFKSSVPFQWYHWLDMSALEATSMCGGSEKPSCRQLFGESHSSVESYCVDDINSPLGYQIVTTPKEGTTIKESILISKSYLFNSQERPIPSEIVFSTNKGLHKLAVDGTQQLVSNFDFLEYQKRYREMLRTGQFIDPLVAWTSLSTYSLTLVAIPAQTAATHTLNESSFQVNIVNTMLNRKTSHRETKYRESLSNSLRMVENSVRTGKPVDKYFSETFAIDAEGNRVGNHYDWRFFSGIKEGKELQIILRRLLRNWLQFTRKAGLKTWIAHGTLLSWYWNSLNFPWEDDVDVQMPIRDLHLLAEEYNQTIYVEDLEKECRGSYRGRYFIDITSSISLRERLDGSNTIDARFIDIDSGIFIDITGLSISKMPPPRRYLSNLPQDFKFMNGQGEEAKLDSYQKGNEILKIYNCRNGHFASISELSPLIPVFIEGELGFVPNSFQSMLTVEYGKSSLTTKRFNGYFFISRLRLWVKEHDLCTFLQNKEAWVESKGEISNKNESCKLTFDEVSRVLELTKDDLAKFVTKQEIAMEYHATRELTYRHFELMKSIRRETTTS